LKSDRELIIVAKGDRGILGFAANMSNLLSFSGNRK